MTLNRTLAAAIAAALPFAATAETAITVYSSASPGTLDARNLPRGYGPGTIPGYALVREDRDVRPQGRPHAASHRRCARRSSIPPP